MTFTGFLALESYKLHSCLTNDIPNNFTGDLGELIACSYIIPITAFIAWAEGTESYCRLAEIIKRIFNSNKKNIYYLGLDD